MAIWVDDGIEFYHRTTRDRNHKTISHFHDVHEMYYLVKGSTKYFIGNEIFVLSAGEIAFVPKGIFHNTNNECKRDIERILLEFDDEFVGESYIPYIRNLSKNKHVIFPATELPKIQEILNRIAEESQKINPDYQEMQKLYLRQLLIFISRYRLKDSKSKSSESFLLIENIMKYISENVGADLSLSTLSQKYNISPNHLSKQFKNISGLPLSEYINISRISAAEKILKKGKYPITRVATECGFNDSNYFAAVFKKYKGITPKKYSIKNTWQRGADLWN